MGDRPPCMERFGGLGPGAWGTETTQLPTSRPWGGSQGAQATVHLLWDSETLREALASRLKLHLQNDTLTCPSCASSCGPTL